MMNPSTLATTTSKGTTMGASCRWVRIGVRTASTWSISAIEPVTKRTPPLTLMKNVMTTREGERDEAHRCTSPGLGCIIRCKQSPGIGTDERADPAGQYGDRPFEHWCRQCGTEQSDRDRHHHRASHREAQHVSESDTTQQRKHQHDQPMPAPSTYEADGTHEQKD
jgi:hypothetical protein